MVSKFCIFVIWNSTALGYCFLVKVVNWFQNFVSLWSETVVNMQQNSRYQLWIGFKILYLCDLKQWIEDEYPVEAVVNWFQNFVSLWSETVEVGLFVKYYWLWIGFKILYLCGLKQLSFCKVRDVLGCDLVSKVCIFVVWNSFWFFAKSQFLVVNWFQNFVSLWSETVKRK